MPPELAEIEEQRIGHTTGGSNNTPPEGAAEQVVDLYGNPLSLSHIYEPDNEWTRWGTATYGNWQTFAESHRLPNGANYRITLPNSPNAIAIVRQREDIRPRIIRLLRSGKIPINTTPSPVWD